jgi:hypothetical protein
MLCGNDGNDVEYHVARAGILDKIMPGLFLARGFLF